MNRFNKDFNSQCSIISCLAQLSFFGPVILFVFVCLLSVIHFLSNLKRSLSRVDWQRVKGVEIHISRLALNLIAFSPHVIISIIREDGFSVNHFFSYFRKILCSINNHLLIQSIGNTTYVTRFQIRAPSLLIHHHFLLLFSSFQIS